MSKEQTSRVALWRARHAFRLVLILLAVFGGDMAAAADMLQRGQECFSHLEGTKALTPDHRVRFSLRALTMDYNVPDLKEVVIDVEPALLDLAFFECNPKLSPAGAVQAEGVGLNLSSGSSPSSNLYPVGIGISAMAHKGLSEYDAYAIKIGFLIPRGQRFGLDLYQNVTRTKNGIPQPDSSFLGAKFIGRSPGGLYARLDCVDFDYTKDRYCHLSEELTDDVLLSVEIPTEKLADWSRYSEIGEKYFLDHAEK